VGDPRLEMGGEGGVGDTRPRGNEVLDVAGLKKISRRDPRRNECVSVMFSPMSLPEYDAMRGYGARSFSLLVAGGTDV
jgi:hypothetical protein